MMLSHSSLAECHPSQSCDGCRKTDQTLDPNHRYPWQAFLFARAAAVELNNNRKPFVSSHFEDLLREGRGGRRGGHYLGVGAIQQMEASAKKD